MTTPCAIVTRPEHEALAWVAALQRRGIAASALPLIGIGAAPDAAALQAARQHLSNYRAIMLVSGNAAQHFFEPNTALALTRCALAAIKKDSCTRVWSPGPLGCFFLPQGGCSFMGMRNTPVLSGWTGRRRPVAANVCSRGERRAQGQ